ncbi:MAG: glycosyltransferase [Candidatus Peribacteraceae bacterium]|jgi:glycosyltransferase involved in cell wall biosynthesis|nr:glycosyltransferase [Candidatus Peribacteraceae bacterium]
MKLLMISGDRSILQGKLGAFWYTLQELRKHFDRIDIICPRVPEKSIEVSESGHRLVSDVKDGGEVFFHPCPDSLLFQKRWIVERGQHLISKHRHEVMTVHDFPPFYNGIGARALNRKTGIPYAIEIHHIVGWPKAADMQEWIGRKLSRWYLPTDIYKAKGVRVVNDMVEKQLVKWGIPEKKIHNLSSLYLDKNVLSGELKPPVSYDIAFCGRLVPNKGLTALLDAVSKLKDVRLLVIGDGPDRIRMEKKVKALKIGNRVTFLGWMPTQEAVSGAMQTARIFVMNSKSEGGPRVALEAMGCGLPVITTKVGIMPEVIEDGKNGLFCDGTSKDLVEKIGILLKNDQKRDDLGKEAKKVLERFERGKLIREYADFLKHLA